MLNKKNNLNLNDLKKANSEILDLFKEIKKEARYNHSRIVLDTLDKLDLNLDYKCVFFQNLTSEDIDNQLKLTELMKKSLFDTQELLRKGTDYGVKLSLDRVITLQQDRLAYGEMTRLRKKQDEITKSALNEIDPMMRVRYFEDIRVLENDILRLEKEAHQYDVIQTTLHSDEVLKNVIKQYSNNKNELVKLETFEKTVNKYSGGSINDN